MGDRIKIQKLNDKSLERKQYFPRQYKNCHSNLTAPM